MSASLYTVLARLGTPWSINTAALCLPTNLRSKCGCLKLLGQGWQEWSVPFWCPQCLAGAGHLVGSELPALNSLKSPNCTVPLLIPVSPRGLWLCQAHPGRLFQRHTGEEIPCLGLMIPRRKFCARPNLPGHKSKSMFAQQDNLLCYGGTAPSRLFKSPLQPCGFPTPKQMTSLSPPCILHPILGSLPIQTSPNCPAPSLFSSLRDSRGISQASFSHGFWGLEDRQGTDSFWHSPSFPSETESRGHLWAVSSQPAKGHMMGCHLYILTATLLLNKPKPSGKPKAAYHRGRVRHILQALGNAVHL